MNEAERFKEIRENLKISQKDLAKKLNINDPQAIKNIESGRVKNIKLNILEKLVEDFNVNLDYLILGKGDIFKKNSNSNQENSNQKKIINGNNNMINVKNNNNINNNYPNNLDDKAKEILDIYTHLPIKEQEKIYHRLKLLALETEDN